MSFDPLDYLRHMEDEADFILEATRAMTFETFRSDEIRKRAVVRSLEILGEAAKKLLSALTDLHPEVDWRAMTRMRDRLIHDYFGVDYEIVWDVATRKVPELRTVLRRMLA